MKYDVGDKVRIVRGIFKGKRGVVTRIDRDPRHSNPYLVKVAGVGRPEHFNARDLS